MALISSKNLDFFDEMDKAMDNALGRFFGGRSILSDWPSLTNNYYHMGVDVVERDDHFEVLADVPGFNADDITLEHNNGSLIIAAERKFEHQDKKTKYYRKERGYNKFYRSFALPENVNIDNINAQLDKGVLKINLPKLENLPNKSIKRIPITHNN
jgi:HSP20 family protein